MTRISAQGNFLNSDKHFGIHTSKQVQNDEFFEVYDKYSEWKAPKGAGYTFRDYPSLGPDVPLLVKAIANHDYRAVKIFLDKGADPAVRGWTTALRDTPITLAIAADDLKMIELLLNYLPEELDIIDDLFVDSSLQSCSLSVIKLLFEKGGGVKQYINKKKKALDEHYLKTLKAGYPIYNDIIKILKNGIRHVSFSKPEHVCEIANYLTDEGWEPIDNEIFQHYIDRGLPLKDAFSMMAANSVLVTPSLEKRMLKGEFSLEDVNFLIQNNPDYINNLRIRPALGMILSYLHNIKGYEFLYASGYKPSGRDMAYALKNKNSFIKDKDKSLSFVHLLLRLGVCPNRLSEAEKIGCRELTHLFLEYGAQI